jgi:hypothetical protein
LFLGQCSAASAYALGQSISPSAAREALSSIFETADTPHENPAQWQTFGRIVMRRLKDSVLIEDGFAVHDGKQNNCEFSFFARAPEGVEEVQIWAGIRCRDRDSRYVFAMRGGKNDDVYLARYAPDGQARFLGIAPLDFHPEPGTWYQLRAIAQGDRIRIYVNGEDLPRLNVRDDMPLWSEGGVSLGGGWLPVQFRNVSVKSLSTAGSAAAEQDAERAWLPARTDKAQQRAMQRSAYRPMVLGAIDKPRTELSLNGQWLFIPDQELSSAAQPQEEIVDDSSWHVMEVPNFWTPSLTWLHGETGFPELNGISATKGISDNLWKAELRRLDGYTFDWRQTSSGWYRQYVELPARTGRRFELRFDAIAKVAEVWVNGHHAGSHVGMFGEVRCDITDWIHPGINAIAVHVVGRLKAEESNQVLGVAVTVEVTAAMLGSLPHGMYRDEAAGIWQPAKLVVTQETWIEDVYTKPHLDRLDFELLVRSRSATGRNLCLAYAIRSAADGTVLYQTPAAESLPIESAEQVLHFSTPHLSPKLWSPGEPHLYRLELTLLSEGGVLDRLAITFGFRTFEARDGRLLLNGKPFWLRGANHFPHALRPNDAALARRFLTLAREGNVAATRSHTAPFSETWLQAADEVGMAVSYEGTWPWLMLEGDPPSDELLQEWSDEFLSLIRKHRNHPSIVLWTVNNEMKFETSNKLRPDRLLRKWKVLSTVVKAMRVADPTRPIVCDSSYCRKSIGTEYENLVVRNGFDDGDIDDAHRYPGWYEPSFFHYYRGEFGKDLGSSGRPLISQEMSTGYPRNDDGHPCRFYLFKHYTPQSLVGYDAYEHRDPAIFLERQALITKELAEAIRRTNRDECSGILHFAYLSWFEDVWNARSIRPFRTYDALKLALQPILVSAELFGRHFYAGSRQRIRTCVCNDAEDAQTLPESELEWRIEEKETVIASGAVKIGPVAYYSNQWCNLEIVIPASASALRRDAQLRLSLRSRGVLRGGNAYGIVVASRSWARQPQSIAAAVLDGNGERPAILQEIGARFAASLQDLQPSEIAIVTNGELSLSNPAIADALRAHAAQGGCVLVFNSGPQLARLFPDQVQGYLSGSGEIATMRAPESPVFDGLDPLDLSWWELGLGQLPRVCRGSHRVASGHDGIEVLAEVVNTHGYLRHPSDFSRVGGTPLFQLSVGAGRWFACELMLLDAALFDPIARRLLSNVLANLRAQHSPGSP